MVSPAGFEPALGNPFCSVSGPPLVPILSEVVSNALAADWFPKLQRPLVTGKAALPSPLTGKSLRKNSGTSRDLPHESWAKWNAETDAFPAGISPTNASGQCPAYQGCLGSEGPSMK